jgi:hypothetical protein
VCGGGADLGSREVTCLPDTQTAPGGGGPALIPCSPPIPFLAAIVEPLRPGLLTGGKELGFESWCHGCCDGC